MTNRPSVPEIITVNSEALQTQIRDLLPSQNGFGSELQATNVITPIIDLTRAAEGSSTPEYLQRALSFGSQTVYNVSNTTTTLINTTGFFDIFGGINVYEIGSAQSCKFSLTDGVSTKIIYEQRAITAVTSDIAFSNPFKMTVFLAAGESLTCTATQFAEFVGSSRQIATGDGTLVNPNGFPL